MSKVPVWKKAKKEADANLQLKIKVLRDFASKGIPWEKTDDGAFVRAPSTGARVLDFYPSNELAFAKWTLKDAKNLKYQNCSYIKKSLENEYGVFQSHGPDSLKKRESTLARVKVLFKTLKATAKDQLTKENQADLLQQSKSELLRWQAVAEQEGAFVLDALEEKGRLQVEVKKLQRALSQARSAMTSMLESKDAEILFKDAEIAELKKRLVEIQRFRPVDD